MKRILFSLTLVLAFVVATFAQNTLVLTSRHCQSYMHNKLHLPFLSKTLSANGMGTCQTDPKTVYGTSTTYNLRTNGGNDEWSSQLFGYPNAASATGTSAYLAFSTDTKVPVVTDAACTSEQTTHGLGRAALSFSHTAGSSRSIGTHTWNYTGSTSIVITKICAWTLASGGVMTNEALLPAAPMVKNYGDTTTIDYTWNY